MEKTLLYQMVDLFMNGVVIEEIAGKMNKSPVEIMELLQSDDARLYADKIREIKRMELEALADGPATQAIRDVLRDGGFKERLHAADISYKAAGKYANEQQTVATLAEVLKKVMDMVSDDNSE